MEATDLLTQGELPAPAAAAPEGAAPLLLPQAAIQLAPEGLYTTRELARLTGAPEHHWMTLVRNPHSGLNGRKVGKAYLISGRQLLAFVEGGKFEFKPRPALSAAFARRRAEKAAAEVAAHRSAKRTSAAAK